MNKEERLKSIEEGAKKKMALLKETVMLNSAKEGIDEGLEWWYATINFLVGILDGFGESDREKMFQHSIDGLRDVKESFENKKPPVKEPEAKQKETA